MTNFRCILLENAVYTTVCVSVSSHFGSQKNLCAVFLVVFRHKLLYCEFKNRYSKKPVSVTKKDISDHIYCLIYISIWFYCSGFGCQNPAQRTTLRPKVRILWHDANSLELLNPENYWPWHCSTTIQKPKKAIYHLKRFNQKFTITAFFNN